MAKVWLLVICICGKSGQLLNFFSAFVCPLVSAQYVGCLEQTKLQGQDTRAFDYFGASVSTSGDLAVVSATDEDSFGTNAGAAYVISRASTGGTTGWYEEAKLRGNDTTRNQYFGRSVSISGDTIVAGNRAFDGAAYVFHRYLTQWYGASWMEQAKLTPADVRGGSEFGRSVAISGNVIAVGAPNGQTWANYAGAVYIFKRSGSTWTQEAKLWSPDTVGGHYFGDLVALSGDTLAVGTNPDAYGSVYIFTHLAQTWSQKTRIDSPKGIAAGDRFGASLAIYHNDLVVGAPGSDEGGTDSGAAYVFIRSGSRWRQQAMVFASDRTVGHRFGRSVAIFGDMMAVAAEAGTDASGNYGGAVYTFTRSQSAWYHLVKSTGKDTSFGDRFGNSISISGQYLLCGAPRKSQKETAAGVVYFLRCTTTTTTTANAMIGTYAPLLGSSNLWAGPAITTARPQRGIANFALREHFSSQLLFVLIAFAACH